MKIVVSQQGDSLLWCGPGAIKQHLVLVNNAREFKKYADADAFIDFDFDGNFYGLAGKPYLVNDTINTFDELKNAPTMSGRFCGWKGFYERTIWEVAVNTNGADWLNPVMNAIGKQLEVVADQPGFIAPRIISMIINEAYYALTEGLSSPEEIDMAMKLGTNYPDGPINWANEIGIHHINDLLTRLKGKSVKYTPHPLLKNFS
jgi:3-hydroxybutyryl-CoA dehydrogenase